MLKLFENEPEDSDLKFIGADVDRLMRFMDPNVDGDLSLDEVQSAVRKLAKGELEVKVTAIFKKLEGHMKRKRQRLLEFFETLDKVSQGGGGYAPSQRKYKEEQRWWWGGEETYPPLQLTLTGWRGRHRP